MAFDTILVGIGPGDWDRTTRVAAETITVAEPTDATVVLLHVFSEDEFEDTARKLEFDPSREDVDPGTVARRDMVIHDLVDAFEDAGVEYAIRGAIGDPAEEIVRVAEAEGADRVFVGGRSRSPTGKAVFGSIAQSVLLSSPCPVTFVRRETDT
ncbi:universal stress protein [Halarchaeum nitratireducens]|uniref:Universal stress protein UspA n=1 Tax=Halarchaeum nitratireducens TaxID=489913 RepID=A0A830GCN9_9EURY|nr:MULTISPECIES: universal stress protein [Halarchaeum]MBP2252358.1 nucleotide-binding universal stress UspA family protein [Halarchaeum solikamskense]GGN20308.1 universal stress protein UspA [Halarchaeum nitratireducens]